MRTEIAIISALALVLSVPVAFGEIVETKGQNYDLVENFFIGEAVWESHPERIMDGGWQNYALTNNAEKVIFNTNSVGSFVFDKNSCSYSIYGNGFDGEQIIPSVSAVATYLNNGQWQNLPINDEACTVTVDRYEDGVFLTSTKVITEDITEDVFIPYTGTTENFYVNATNANFDLIQSSNGTNTGYFNGETRILESVEVEKFVQELRLDINSGFKETFKVWHDGSEELGISQTVHTGESITIGEQTINIAELNGQSFDRQFIIDNQAEILAITDSVNYDFDTGIESLSNINIIFDGDYKVNMDYADGGFVGYLEIDPTFGITGADYSNLITDRYCDDTADSPLNAFWTGKNSNTYCYVPAIGWDISSIDDGATIDNVKIFVSTSGTQGSQTCTIRSMEGNPATQTDQQTLDDINNGNTYVSSNTSFCQGGAQTDVEVDLGSMAITDLTDDLAGDVFSIGVDYNVNSVSNNVSYLTNPATAFKLQVAYTVPIAPQPPTGLTTVTGIPIELDWTAPTDNGGSAITGYKVFRTLNEFAQTELPNNSANANGVDFTDNEFLVHGFETVTTSTLTYEDDFSTDNFDTQGTKNQVNTGTGVIDFDFNRDGSNHKTKIDTTLGNEFVVRWTQTWDNIAYNSGNPIGFIGLGNTAETVNILSTTNDFLGFEIIVDNSGVVELRAVSAIGESIFSSNHDDTLTKSPAENETLGYEIIRYSDTDWKINIYDSTFTTLEDTTGLLTTASSSLDTTNFMVATYPSSSHTSQGDGTISNLEIYNGVTSTDDVVTQELPDKSTNSISITNVIRDEGVTWDSSNTSGFTISGNTITKTTGTGWNNYAISTNTFNPSTGGGEFEFTTDLAHTMMGFSNGVPTTANSYTVIDYAMYPLSSAHTNGGYKVNVYENGSLVCNNCTNWYVGDTFKQTMDSNGLVKYYKNDVVFYTSTQTASGDYYIHTTIHEPTNAQASATIPIPPSTTSTTGVIDTGVQNPDLSYTDSNLPDNTDDFSVGSWVKLNSMKVLDDDFTSYTSDSNAETSYPTGDNTSIKVDTSTDKIEYTFTRSPLIQTYLNHDITGSVVEDNWVLRIHELVATTKTGGITSFIGLSNSDTALTTTSQNFAGLEWGSNTGNHGYSTEAVYNSAITRGAEATTLTVGTTYYAEVIKSGTTVTTNIYSDSGFSTLVHSSSSTFSSNPTDLRYFKITSDTPAGSNEVINAEISKIEFYNGVDDIDDYNGNTKLLGLNDVTFNVGTTSASVVKNSISNVWSFDGINDYVELGTTTSDFNLMHEPNGKWSTNFWYKTSSLSTAPVIFDNTNSQAGSGMMIQLQSDGKIKVGLHNAGSQWDSRTSAGIAQADGNWHMVTITMDLTLSTNNLKIYHDNGSPTQFTKSGSQSSGNAGSIMKLGSYSGGGAYYNGLLDQVLIYDKVLSSSEVSALYNGGSGTGIFDTNGLFTHYNFEQTSGDLLDQTSNNNDGTNNGATQTATGFTLTNSIISATGLSDNTSSPQHYTFTRSANDWEIYQNGAQVGSTVTDSTSLGANGITGFASQSVTWDSTTSSGVSISGNTITKTAGDGWTDGIAQSTQTISPSTGGGEVTFTKTLLHSMGGLAKDPYWTSGNTQNTADYLMYDNVIQELGTTPSGNCSSNWSGGSDSTVHKITMDENGLVKYYVDGTLHCTSGVTASGNYYFQGSIYGNGDSVTGSITSYGIEQPYTTNISGMIDEYFIDSTALTSTEIDQVYENGKPLTPIATTNAVTTDYDDSSVVGGNNYYFSVKATNAVGDSDFLTPFVAGLAGTPADPPSSVSSGINSPNTAPLDITVSWSSPTNVGSGTLTGFEIYRDGVLIDTTGLVTSYTDTVPSGGGTFEYKLKSLSTHGTSGFSGTTSTTTPTVPPTPTTTPTLAINNPNPSPFDIDVSWSAQSSGGSTITGYEIFRSADDITFTSVGTVTDLDFTDTVPSAGTWYYTFASTNLVGSSGQSPSNSITTATVPSSPLNASSVIPSVNSAPYDVTVSWELPTSTGGSDLTGYNVYRQTGSGAFTLVTTTTALGYVDTVPTALNQDYTFKIHSLNNVGESTGFVTTTITTGDVPDAPVLSSTTGTTSLSWTVPSSDASITGYEIYRDTVLLTTVTTTTHSDFTTINFGQSYAYDIKAVSSLGSSVLSNTIISAPETEITGMIAQGITGTGAVIDWDEPAYYQGQITNYEVYYSEVTASVTTPITSAGTTTNTYSNFAPTLDYDTTYIFGVKIVSPLGNSGFSNYVTVTTSVDGSIVAYDPTTGTIDWFDIDSVSEQTVNVIEFQRETQTINGTATDTLQVAYPSWWDDMTCDVDYKFAQKTEQYVEGDDMTAQVNSADANQQVIGFAFQDIDNEVIEVECAPQVSQHDDEVSAKYIMTQQTLGNLQADGTYSSGIPSIPLVAQIQAFQTGDYGTDGSFGALDVVGLFVILISMVGFNRVSPIVGVLLSASLVFALSFFGIISLPTVLVGVVALVIFLAWGIQRNR